jgi:lipid-A-disaccharide synthase-like uncharacterized protein
VSAVVPADPLVVGFTIWDAVGWLGQVLFTLRVLVQWWASERAGRSLVPRSFWWLSLAGTLVQIVYFGYRRDPVFLAGAGVSAAIYTRNLVLMRRREVPTRAQRGPWMPLLLGLGVTAGLVVLLAMAGARIVRFDLPLGLLIYGFLAQTLWTSRFVWQWVTSERAGRSTLSASFFLLSTVAALLMLGYAVARVDWVMMAAFVFNPIPYVRNLVLLRREATGDAA